MWTMHNIRKLVHGPLVLNFLSKNHSKKIINERNYEIDNKNLRNHFWICCCFLSQCDDDILESTSYGQVTSQQFWRNGDDVVSAVNAIYEPLLQENYFGHFERTWDIQSDDMWRAGDHAEDQSIEYFTYDASNPKLIDTWKWRYEMISRVERRSDQCSKGRNGRIIEKQKSWRSLLPERIQLLETLSRARGGSHFC